MGLEPTHLSIPEPKSGAATNYAKGAKCKHTNTATTPYDALWPHSRLDNAFTKLGATGRNRTGTPLQRQILSLLWLPITPQSQISTIWKHICRNHYANFAQAAILRCIGSLLPDSPPLFRITSQGGRAYFMTGSSLASADALALPTPLTGLVTLMCLHIVASHWD